MAVLLAYNICYMYRPRSRCFRLVHVPAGHKCPYLAFNLDHGGPQLPGIQPFIMTTNLCLHRSIHIFNNRFCPHEGLFVVILRIFLSGATMYGPPNPKLQGHNKNTTLNKEHFNSEHFCGCCDTCTSLKQLTNITDNMLITRQDKVREACQNGF